MAGLKVIKQKIRATGRTRQVTRAMEAVSAAKMRKAQQQAFSARSYARAALGILSRLSGSLAMRSHPLVQGNASEKSLYIVITSDKGLAGALNTGVLRLAARDMQARGLSAENTSVIAVGRKAQDFFSRRGFNIESSHLNTDELTAELLQQIVDEAANRFAEGEVGLVRVVYQNFVSTFEQRPLARTLFPIDTAEFAAIVHEIVPARGKFAEPMPEQTSTLTYTVEPSEEDVLTAIVPRLAGVFVYHALLESQASEHSARMVAMKSASDKALEMSAALTRTFNKARQAAITREVSEITGGMEAMA